MRRHRSTTLLSLALVLGAVALAGCGGSAAKEPDGRPRQAAPGPGVVLSLDFATAHPGDTVVDGRLGAATVRVVSNGDGAIVFRADRDSGAALSFPTVTQARAGDLAVLLVDTDDPADLAPGSRDFRIQADVRVSQLPPTGAGANVIQRGLYRNDQTGQYKLQLDNGRPSCRISGTGGAVTVKASEPVTTSQWYRLVCLRGTDHVTLKVGTWHDDGKVTWQEWTIGGRTGSLGVGPGLPLSVGGKTNPDGTLVLDAPDQFTGRIDNIQVAIT